MSPANTDLTTLELAQALAERLRIDESNWHKLKSNRPARAKEQAAAALVLLLKDNPDEALARFAQAVGWLDKSISAPPCPSHGDKVRSRVNTIPNMVQISPPTPNSGGAGSESPPELGDLGG